MDSSSGVVDEDIVRASVDPRRRWQRRLRCGRRRRRGVRIKPHVDALRLGQVDALVGEVKLEPWLLTQLQRQTNGEDAATAQLALQGDLPAEQLAQLADDREAQAGAGVLAGQRV